MEHSSLRSLHSISEGLSLKCSNNALNKDFLFFRKAGISLSRVINDISLSQNGSLKIQVEFANSRNLIDWSGLRREILVCTKSYFSHISAMSSNSLHNRNWDKINEIEWSSRIHEIGLM